MNLELGLSGCLLKAELGDECVDFCLKASVVNVEDTTMGLVEVCFFGRIKDTL